MPQAYAGFEATVVADQYAGDCVSGDCTLKGWPGGRAPGEGTVGSTSEVNSWIVGSRQPRRAPTFLRMQWLCASNQVRPNVLFGGLTPRSGDRSQTSPVSRSNTAAPSMFERTMNRGQVVSVVQASVWPQDPVTRRPGATVCASATLAPTITTVPKR